MVLTSRTVVSINNFIGHRLLQINAALINTKNIHFGVWSRENICVLYILYIYGAQNYIDRLEFNV